MDWLDIALAVVVLSTLWTGYHRGLVLETLGLLSLAASLVVALFYAPMAANVLQNFTPLPMILALPVGAVMIFVVVRMAIGIVVGFALRSFLPALHRVPIVGSLDRLGGAALAGVRIVVVLALAAAALLPALRLLAAGPITDAIARSRATPMLSAVGNRLAPGLSAFMPAPTADLLDSLPIQARHVGENESVRLHLPPGLNPIPDAESEQIMVAYINEQRSSRGLVPLVLDATLAATARAHSEDMFRQSYFGHQSLSGTSPFDRIRAAGIRYNVAGENIAYAPTVGLADEGLMRSPEHRANLLRPEFRRVGVGVMNGGFFERMFTQDFTG
jgi:uncharacterized protein YkwD/uncharacterized membrane protein required for colicin V production